MQLTTVAFFDYIIFILFIDYRERVLVPLLLLLTLPPSDNLPRKALDVLMAPTTTRHLIGGLPSELLATLACQFLDVRAVSDELEE